MKHSIFHPVLAPQKQPLSSYGIDYSQKKIHPKRLGQIFFKNFLLMLLIVTIPILIIVGISYYTMDNFLKNEIQNYSSKSIKSLENTTSRVVEECLSQMNYLVSDSDISVFLQTKSGEPAFYNYTYLQKLVKIQLSTREYLHSIYIFSDQNHLVISPSGLGSMSTLYDTGWLTSYLHHDGEENVWMEIRNNGSASSSSSPKKFLSIFLTANYGQKNTGVVVFNIDWNKFCSMIINDGLIVSEDALGIVDENFELISPIHGDCQQYLDSSSLLSINQEADYTNVGSRVLFKAPFNYTDWHFVLSVPLATYESGIAPIMAVMLIIIFSGILVTLLVAFLISLRIYRPFRNIIGLLQKPVTYVDNHTEIHHNEEAYILASIRSTIKENEEISQELAKRISLLKTAQQIALQSQINPHFLYNTLDAINWMAMRLTGGRNDASIMLSKLAAMLRYSLENPESMVSLDMEINNVRTYLELQELRYKGQFTVEWDIEPGLSNYKMIKLILQPIVENSIYHGLRPSSTPGIIKLSAHRQNNNLIFEVLDTGVGINSKLLEQLNTSLRSSDINKEGHIGIQNVNQRIRLFFGDAYGIVMKSEEGSWTQVIIRLPLIDSGATPLEN